MFETGKAIREAKLKQIWDDGREEGRKVGREEGIREGIELVRMALEEYGVSLPPDVTARLYDEKARNGS